MSLRNILENGFAQIRTQGVVATVRSLWHRAQVRWEEGRLGIHTDASIELSELGIHNEECKHYGATDYHGFRKTIQALAIRPQEHVFLDYGAGMGRAMILAATYPFERVHGVEISPELTEIARQNIDRCRSKLSCQTVEIATCDATLYQIPAGVSVFYFNNPFYGDILATVLNNVRAHVAHARRPLWVVCNLPVMSAFEKQIRKLDWLELSRDFALPNERHCLIFSATPTRAVDAAYGSPVASAPPLAN